LKSLLISSVVLIFNSGVTTDPIVAEGIVFTNAGGVFDAGILVVANAGRGVVLNTGMVVVDTKVAVASGSEGLKIAGSTI
jgi:hypothetical protein